VSGTVGLIGVKDKQTEEFVRLAGMRPIVLQAEDLASPRGALSATPDVVLVDVRSDRNLLGAIAGIKRRHPQLGIAIIVPALEPEVMLQAMRSGVTECIAEPLTQDALESSISRVRVQRAAPVEGRVFAIIGAKGGVGATTIAVNLAESIARSAGETLLIDMNVATGDAAVFLGVDPRFTIVDALENTGRLDENFFRSLVVHTPSGLDLLASSVRVLTGPVDPQRVRTLIDFSVRYYRARRAARRAPRARRARRGVIDLRRRQSRAADAERRVPHRVAAAAEVRQRSHRPPRQPLRSALRHFDH